MGKKQKFGDHGYRATAGCHTETKKERQLSQINAKAAAHKEAVGGKIKTSEVYVSWQYAFATPS